MRKELEQFLGQRRQFSAVLARTCVCKRQDFALLVNVRDENGRLLTDHAWVKLTNELNRVVLGEEICFVATVGQYERACGDIDFNLNDVLLLY